VPDVVRAELDVLFCGINPGLWTAAVGHHFARPGNRFWKVLHGSGFSPEVLEPWEEERFLQLGFGITNLVGRATATAAELGPDELRAGARQLEATAARWRPRFVAVVGMGAYRTAFGRPKATIGRQPEALADSALWLLPNPSGLQATYQMPELVAAFKELRETARPD
jgi:TDG/mug DNA glycosylase family protein